MKKERTLSDDSEEEGGGWMAKPRMMTSKASKKAEPKVRARRDGFEALV